MNKSTREECGICAECVPQINGGSGFTNCADAHAAETAGDKMPFTKEQLIELTREDVEFWRERDELIPSMQTAMRLRQTEIALAALTAEPVMFCMEIGGTLDEQSVSDCQSVVSAWVEEWNNHDRSPGEPAYKTVALYRLPLLEGGNNVE